MYFVLTYCWHARPSPSPFTIALSLPASTLPFPLLSSANTRAKLEIKIQKRVIHIFTVVTIQTRAIVAR